MIGPGGFILLVWTTASSDKPFSQTWIQFFVAAMLYALLTYCFYRVIRGDFLKPSKERVEAFASTQSKITGTAKQLTTKTMIATKEWADKKALEVEEAKKAAANLNSFIESAKRRVTSAPLEVIVLGGAGWESEKGNKFLLSLDDKYVYMSDLQKLTDTMIDIDHLIEMEISGPGKVSSDAGVMGGGFGAEGALKGIAIATVINILTSHSSTKTFIRLSMRDTELVMLTSKMEPDQAKLMLSPIAVRIRKKSQPAALSSVTAELQKLHDLKVSGVISDDEFARLKENLIRNGV
jgi:hypothetical protein